MCLKGGRKDSFPPHSPLLLSQDNPKYILNYSSWSKTYLCPSIKKVENEDQNKELSVYKQSFPSEYPWYTSPDI